MRRSKYSKKKTTRQGSKSSTSKKSPKRKPIRKAAPKRKPIRKAPPKRKPIRKVYRDSNGRFTTKTKAKRGAKRKSAAKRKVSRASELRKPFANRRPRVLGKRDYPDHPEQPTRHIFHRVPTDPERLKRYTKKFANRATNLIVKFVDSNGETQYRKTVHTFGDESDLLIEYCDEMLNKYSNAGMIARIKNFTLDTWDTLENWDGYGDSLADSGEDSE